MEDEKSDLQRQLQNEKNARQLQEQFNEDQQKIQQALHKEQITTEAQKVGMVAGTVSRVLVETSEGLGKGGKFRLVCSQVEVTGVSVQLSQKICVAEPTFVTVVCRILILYIFFTSTFFNNSFQ